MDMDTNLQGREKFITGVVDCNPTLIWEALRLGYPANESATGTVPALVRLCSQHLEDHPDAVECVELLLSYGADPEASADGVTPLKAALSSSMDIRIIEMLFKAGAQLEAAKPFSEGADEVSMYLSVSRDFDEEKCKQALDILIKNGLDLSRQPVSSRPTRIWLFDAIATGNMYFIHKSIEHGAKLDGLYIGLSLLGQAALYGRENIFNLLMDHGATSRKGCRSIPHFKTYLAAWQNKNTARIAAACMSSEEADQETTIKRRPGL